MLYKLTSWNRFVHWCQDHFKIPPWWVCWPLADLIGIGWIFLFSKYLFHYPYTNTNAIMLAAFGSCATSILVAILILAYLNKRRLDRRS
jgi:hypothetical protein